MKYGNEYRGAILAELPPTPAPGALYGYDPYDHHPMHFHGQLEWLVVWRGRARFRIGSTDYELRPGSLVCILPNRMHMLLEASDDLDFGLIFADPEYAQQVYTQNNATERWLDRSPFAGWLPEMVERMGPNLVCTVAHGELAVFRELFVEQHQRQLQGDVPDLALLLQAARQFTLQRAPSEHGVAEEVFAWVVAEPWLTAPELARRLGVSQSWMTRCLKQGLGNNLAELRGRVRTHGRAAAAGICRSAVWTRGRPLN